ncbi:MAG: 16S rRNA (adenine(1518)-N(6)/adenine(1519)-N(6))-dimethyltransferase RsmA [Candidatus Bathyarchaeota archaeon]
MKKTKYLLMKYKITPKKQFSQNFLVAPLIFPRLAEYASLNQRDTVLEIGAGLGFLTSFLADKCKHLIAIESDSRLIKLLHGQLRDRHNIDIVEDDVLTANLGPFDKVISVPPYHISSPLLLWLFKREFECAVLIFQKDFAERIIAPVGSKHYGWLSVVTYYNTQVRLLTDVPRKMFYPQPNVDSIIVFLESRKQPPFYLKDEMFFQQLVQAFFSHRNRKVKNAALFFIESKKITVRGDAIEVVSSLPYRRRRVAELTPKEFGELANELKNQSSNHK